MIRLPTHARLTVTTTVEEIKSKIFGNYEVFTHTADQLHTRLLRPLTVVECLEAGLIRRIERGWMWSEVAYERLASNGRRDRPVKIPVFGILKRGGKVHTMMIPDVRKDTLLPHPHKGPHLRERRTNALPRL